LSIKKNTKTNIVAAIIIAAIINSVFRWRNLGILELSVFPRNGILQDNMQNSY